MNVVQAMREEVRQKAVEYKRMVAKHQNLLARLPDMPASKGSIWFGYGILTYWPHDNMTAEEIRGAVQRATGKIARREASANTSHLYYTFTVPGLEIRVYQARLAPSCELVEVEETVKRFKVVCPDGEPTEAVAS